MNVPPGLANFKTWPLMSVHYWGEEAAGRWELTITNAGDRTAFLAGGKLILYGTQSQYNT